MIFEYVISRETERDAQEHESKKSILQARLLPLGQKDFTVGVRMCVLWYKMRRVRGMEINEKQLKSQYS